MVPVYSLFKDKTGQFRCASGGGPLPVRSDTFPVSASDIDTHAAPTCMFGISAKMVDQKWRTDGEPEADKARSPNA